MNDKKNEPLIEWLLSEGGKPSDITWTEIGLNFGITAHAARFRWKRFKEKRQTPSDAQPAEIDLQDFGEWNIPRIPKGMVVTKIWGQKTNPSVTMHLPEGDIDETLVQKIDQTFERILTKNYESISKPTLPLIDSFQNTLIVVVSDIHVGSKIDENVMFDVTYDKNVFQDRMKQVLKFILQKRQKNKEPFEKFILFDLGDSLDGHDGKTTRGTLLPQNMDTAQQWETYTDTMVNLWKNIVSDGIAKSYEFVGASCSNHGGQMDYIAMQSVGKIIKNIFEVDYFVSRKFIDLKIIKSNGVQYNFIFTHGKDDRDRKYGLSLTLDSKTREYIQGVIDGWGVSNTKNTIVLKGDLHQSAYTRSHNRWHYVSCPSVFGSSGHAINNYTATEPGFYFEILDGQDRMTGIKDFE